MSDEVGGVSGTKPASGGKRRQGRSGGEGTTTIRPLITAAEV